MESEYKQFKNPPIKEAIFGITFKEPVALNLLNSFCQTDFIKNKFPVKEPGVILEFSHANGNPIAPITKADGYILKCGSSCDRSIQVRPTFISYHNFNKYAGWEVMFEELKNIWNVFCKVVGKTTISNLNVRYINQIILPNSSETKLSDYINLLPKLPDSMQKQTNGFFLQVNIPDSNYGLQGIITETILPEGTTDKNINLLLDLQVMKHGEFECNEDEMWGSFVNIRNFKNELFYNCITEKTEKLFDYA